MRLRESLLSGMLVLAAFATPLAVLAQGDGIRPQHSAALLLADDAGNFDNGDVAPDNDGGGDLPQRQGGINLLAPLGNQTNIAVQKGFGTFLTYFNDAGTWLIYVAMGLCVLWVLLGGFMIMLSGADSGLRSKGIGHMRWAITGLVILAFAGFILRTLNSMFFK